MSRENISPITVEIVARFGRKVSVRIRFGLTIAAVIVLISTVSKFLG